MRCEKSYGGIGTFVGLGPKQARGFQLVDGFPDPAQRVPTRHVSPSGRHKQVQQVLVIQIGISVRGIYLQPVTTPLPALESLFDQDCTKRKRDLSIRCTHMPIAHPMRPMV